MATDRLLDWRRDDSPPPSAVRARPRVRAHPHARARQRAPAEPAAIVLSELAVNCEAHEDLVLVALDGDLDTYTTPAFREHLRRYDPAEVQLVIDLTGVRLLDSAGLGALMSLGNEAHRAGGALGVVCPSHSLVRVFWVTGLRPAFVFGDDLAAMRAALAARRGRTGSGAALTR
jgi:anti-sigma B factor antagonist